MPEYLRVTVKDTKHKLSLLKSVVDANPDAYNVLKQDAVDVAGEPLPPEHHTDNGQTATTTSKES
jgi:hypothetical protein